MKDFKKEEMVEVKTSSQGLIKDGFELLGKFRPKDNWNYYALIKCINCGEEKFVNYYNFVDKTKIQHPCINCKYDKLIGEIVGPYEILGIDHIEKVKTNSKLHNYVFCKVRCIHCKKEQILLYNKTNWKRQIGCSQCGRICGDKSSSNMWYDYTYSAKNRKITWDLTPDQFKKLIHENCFYCGKTPDYRKSDCVEEKVNGIDRLDSTKGYTIDNCVPCCSICNKMKQTFTVNEFLQKISEIYSYKNLISQGSETISKESTL